jgi:hypothetical protein
VGEPAQQRLHVKIQLEPQRPATATPCHPSAIQIPAKPTTMVCRDSVASARLARAAVVNPIAMFIEHEKQSEEAEPQERYGRSIAARRPSHPEQQRDRQQAHKANYQRRMASVIGSVLPTR